MLSVPPLLELLSDPLRSITRGKNCVAPLPLRRESSFFRRIHHHGFHETKQGVRYTIGELARREVLARLLKLNHEHFAEEVKQGLHQKKKGKRKGRKKTDDLGALFGGPET